ncbi:phage tail protein [Nocardia sp. N2S4-5]|uniref:phage tail protein n=1 Tax=Nocardia sp. N2S4-5 TaxID=3351565 RepID=UPI0037D8EAEA
MALPDFDTTAVHSLALEIDSVLITPISEVSGLGFGQDVIELKQNTPDGKYLVRKLPGRPKAGEVTLTRAVTDDKSFEKWITESRSGDPAAARKNGAVIIYDLTGRVVRRYELTGMSPRAFEVGTVRAGDSGVLTEKLIVTYENLEIE